MPMLLKVEIGSIETQRKGGNWVLLGKEKGFNALCCYKLQCQDYPTSGAAATAAKLSINALKRWQEAEDSKSV